MSKNTAISWTNATWNPWHGCKKVSTGCKYCYMYRDKDRYGQNPTQVIRSSKSTFNLPKRLKEPQLVFTCSWSDFFIQEADQWRAEAWQIIKNTPHLTYQILTKRPERIKDCLPPDWGENGYPNVWIGISAENQTTLEQRWPYFLDFPARVKFLSLEPLIGPLELNTNRLKDREAFRGRSELLNTINWVIVGGESGNKTGKYRYRECNTLWIESIYNACIGFGIPLFIKQLGTHLASIHGLKSKAGADPKEVAEKAGINMIQEFPKQFTYNS